MMQGFRAKYLGSPNYLGDDTAVDQELTKQGMPRNTKRLYKMVEVRNGKDEVVCKVGKFVSGWLKSRTRHKQVRQVFGN